MFFDSSIKFDSDAVHMTLLNAFNWFDDYFFSGHLSSLSRFRHWCVSYALRKSWRIKVDFRSKLLMILLKATLFIRKVQFLRKVISCFLRRQQRDLSSSSIRQDFFVRIRIWIFAGWRFTLTDEDVKRDELMK